MNTTNIYTPMPTAPSELQPSSPSEVHQEVAKVDQTLANEQLRQAILDKKQAQIEAWSAQIEQLQQGMQSVAENLRDETEKRLEELRQARGQARAQLESLQQATQDSWDSLLQKSDHFFQDLAERFHAFVSAEN
ncbi:hypothetical protein [Cyanobium sp. NS01]|uniref:hypothetical protein n=1 Tax=Cyanobium sp. NS01 TaxID=261284 RepID=UPI00186155E9|nr:hypothetical protein [Cyanobium sp. NS01]QNI69698.1 hypothetical protein CyaNS01_00547 [Cyanobium sp. NS01]